MNPPSNLNGALWSLLLMSLLLFSSCSPPPETSPVFSPTSTPQAIESTALFIGISVVNDQTVWISGTSGTYARTTNGGASWETGVVPGADSLQFRDVHAFSDQHAFLLSIGNGDQSRIYRTMDGGTSWEQVFTNQEEQGFFDCMDFWDENNGIAFSDSFEGSFYLITTSDGGTTWTRIDPAVLPPALEGEGSFAASGTCLITEGSQTAYVGTGAGGAARVMKTTDRGATWSVVETPVSHGTPSSGLASVSFLNSTQGVVAGGEISKPDSIASPIAITEDAGATWTLASPPSFTGAIYGVSYVPGQSTPTLVAAGPKGVAYSTDNGTTWMPVSEDNYWSVAFAENGHGWVTGTEGKILKITPGGEDKTTN